MLKKALKQYLTVSLLILFGSVVWSLTMIKSGIMYTFGHGFWGPNGHDGIWHIALSESLSRGSLINPVFSGEVLKNYHLGFDIVLTFIHKLTSISVSILYFQVLPVIFAILIGYLVYVFVLSWRGSKNEALWSVFFVYFSSSFGFLVTFLRDGVFTGESMFWSQQSISTLVNPPFVMSLIFILAGLIALMKKKLLLGILFFGVLIQVKAYAAILVLGALFISGIYSYFKLRSTNYLRVFIGSLILNLFLFYLVKNDSLTVFAWHPFWFLETLMTYSDRLGWDRFYSAMTTYRMGRIWFKAILAYGVAFGVFLVGNMGLRIIGFNFAARVIKGKEKLNGIVIFIFSVISIALAIPMFFVQNGTPWNTIQFFYYYLFFFSIFTGISTNWIVKNVHTTFKIVLLTIIVVFSVLGSWATLQHYLPKMPPSILLNEEYEALDFLNKQPDGIVLTYPFDKYKAKEAEKFPPRPLYLYESTSYVSAFTNKQVFLEDEVNLNIMGYEWKIRKDNIMDWYKESDQEIANKFLAENNISYVYWVKPQRALLGDAELGLEEIFENKTTIIYKYGKDFGGN